MFFVYGDNIASGQFKHGVIAVITTQVLAFLLSLGMSSLQLADGYPLSFLPIAFSIEPLKYSYSLITAAFIHAGALHLLGNVMFFWAFGRTLENLFGTLSFVAAYLVLGALAFLGSWLVNPNSSTGIVGSSGAVAFLMGVYLVLFPRARLKAVVTIPPFYKTFLVRAYAFVLVWVAIQIYSVGQEMDGGADVAYATHLMGFLIGLAAAATWKEFAMDTEDRLANLHKENRNEG